MIFYSSSYSNLDLPERHRFPIEKYRTLYETLLASELAPLLRLRDDPIDVSKIKLCHQSDYVDAFLAGCLDPTAVKKMGFPWSPELVNRTLISLENARQSALYALNHNWAVNLSGGYHHALPAAGAGFCIFNDFAVVAHDLIHQELVDRVLIFDCDVHQGDGTALLCEHNPSIITCSIHCEQNFPRSKAQSDLDFPLPIGTNDTPYLNTVHEALDLAIRLYQPDIVLYNAGADISAHDELGLLKVSLQGVKDRDNIVLSRCFEASLPIAIALGGGYQRNTERLNKTHNQLFNALLDNLINLV